MADDHPIYVVAAWLGNTPRIAMKHYLQVTEADYEKALQKAVQQPAATRRPGSQGKSDECGSRLVLPGNAKPCESMQLDRVELIGLEPTTC